jgi:Bacterial SH3 domain
VGREPKAVRSPSCARRRTLLAAALAGLLSGSGCARLEPPPEPPPAPAAAPDPSIYRRADADRLKLLEAEVERLRADLRNAEETLMAVESGLREAQTRAEVVSQLAEARIQVDRAAKRAPWRAEAVAEARQKLDEADRQLADGHVGSAIFFVSRASRVAATLQAEADRVASAPLARSIAGSRVNLRAEPDIDSEVLEVLQAELPVFPESELGEWVLIRTVSGKVGWVHASLLAKP